MRIKLSDNFILSLGDDFDNYEQKIIYLESIKDSKLSFDKYLLETTNQLIYKGLNVSAVYLWFNTDILCVVTIRFLDIKEEDVRIIKKIITKDENVVGNDYSVWIYDSKSGITFSSYKLNIFNQFLTI